MTIALRVGDEWIGSTGSSFAVTNPHDGATIATVPMGDAALLDRAIAAAHKAFASTRTTPAEHRAAQLANVARLIESRRSKFTNLIVAEAGKPIVFAEAEVNRAIWTFTDAANEARRFNDAEPIDAEAFPSGKGHRAVVRRFPVGVVYGLSPFNFPLNLVAHKIAPTIACGNTIVLKPSPRTPLSVLKLARVLEEAGVPAGQVNVVTCPNELAAGPVTDPRVKHVSFTGSVPAGWGVRKLAPEKPMTLELGGNAGCIVHADADWRAAIAPIATGAFGVAGQSCISVQRLFVHDSIYDAFAAAFVEHVKGNVKHGDPRDRAVIVGPMIDEAARQRTLAAIEAARSAGARVLCGGTQDGPCITGTVIADADPSLDVCAKEIFAPVVVLARYSDFEDALARVNDSPFGLQAGVYTRDPTLAQRAFEALEVGAVMINQVSTFRLENQPYGGMKQSGLGREGARYAIEGMTEVRVMATRL